MALLTSAISVRHKDIWLSYYQRFLWNPKIYVPLSISDFCQTQKYMTLLPSAISMKKDIIIVSFTIGDFCQTQRYMALLPSAISVKYKDICLSYHWRFLSDTKIYDSLAISDFCETQKYMALLLSAISVRHKNICLSYHRRFFETQSTVLIMIGDFYETQP